MMNLYELVLHTTSSSYMLQRNPYIYGVLTVSTSPTTSYINSIQWYYLVVVGMHNIHIYIYNIMHTTSYESTVHTLVSTAVCEYS